MNAPPHVIDGTDLAEFIRDRGPQCLIIERHGETEWNARGRLQGQKDIPLNNRGRNQAADVAELLRNVPLLQAYSSTLGRCRTTVQVIVSVNTSRPGVIFSDLLRETTLGVLEGELKDHQSTAELSKHYQNFSMDEINTRVPGSENLHDVEARVQRFFADQDELLSRPGVQLVVGHRNLNKMVLKYIVGLSFKEGLRIEQEHQRLYLYFGASKELWSCWIESGTASLTKGYVTTMNGSYA
jgi:broad specificity phosphatase PhoE